MNGMEPEEQDTEAAARLRAKLGAWALDPFLAAEPGFAERAKARDELEFMGPFETAGAESPRAEARALLARWDDLDAALFARLRTELRSASAPAACLRKMFDRYVPGAGAAPGGAPAGYDELDLFCNGLLHPGSMPGETLALPEGMVGYHKTPARVALEVIEAARLGPDDLFCDVGSGLGQVCLLARLLSGARAVGIEIEPAYAAYARSCAAALGLEDVAFEAADALAADFSAPNVLFLYTPFRGALLEKALARIEAQGRSDLRLFAFGPCREFLESLDWLRPAGAPTADGPAGFVRRRRSP